MMSIEEMHAELTETQVSIAQRCAENTAWSINNRSI